MLSSVFPAAGIFFLISGILVPGAVVLVLPGVFGVLCIAPKGQGCHVNQAKHAKEKAQKRKIAVGIALVPGQVRAHAGKKDGLRNKNQDEGEGVDLDGHEKQRPFFCGMRERGLDHRVRDGRRVLGIGVLIIV